MIQDKAIIPVLIGAFSVDKDRNYANNLNNLGYVKIPNALPIDLRLGEYEPKASYDPYERLHQITGFLKDRKTEVDIVSDGQVQSDIVCSGGVLKGIMTAEYDVNTWVLDAFKFGSTIFLCMNSEVTPQHNARATYNNDSSKFSRYGFKFESYVQAKTPNGTPPGSTKKVIEAEEFIIVNRAQIGDLQVMYSCEIVGVKSDEKIKDFKQLKGKELIEVKLKAESAFYRMKVLNNKKSIVPWWSSAYLAGINQFVVGLRGSGTADDDMVLKIHQESLESLSSTMIDLQPILRNNLKINLVTIRTKVNEELNGKSSASFCRFECTKNRSTNSNEISFVKTCTMNNEMKEKVFVKNLKNTSY